MATPDNTHCKYQFTTVEANDVRLTSFTDFGLRMLMRMAGAPERVFSTAELATEFGLPRNHLAKIIQRLAHAGIVETRRGGGGGAQLARPPQAITLGEIVRQLEVGHPIVECFAEMPGLCSLDGKCRLKFRLRAAELAFLAELDRHVLADIALENVPTGGPPLPQQTTATPRSDQA
ncbi:Rrf2 family transcriptional regulator [Sphingobium sp. HBC34]|jgi:Rrf2 family nitric oxide-sensitive transcriptional repressor|uniref:Rrf2 family transcriptional regulator n=1 Tax=Sphingobium cyanobacteriorum TaxID=3063954 RepID=A0ABT8ZSG1_9SPHN|nr:Rrf2 family transcriptional regulator [Sphingobium sp. HBC34]MDE1918417.1 Rrf2 family transcriptional regulator [Sphingomonadales bacterium]MDE2171257.1 Rrf2 family transcriptional regulator [Sphingomonadales bacterium]MDO7837126.1 Rrf2 family transcriptional regulator [Sphingobium sp. HBC34]